MSARKSYPPNRIAIALTLVLSATFCSGYTVLTHEAIVDAVWADTIQKVILKKYPNATPEELEKAHAYAYGGCIIQDIGYYPFGSRFFSDLTHYVRSGDFVAALIRESQDINEYAFALGALEHYVADTEGHKSATNRAVPLLYPELKRKYGNDVTYWEDPTAHVRTEFGFDVLQVALGRYAPDNYRKFIGFEVAQAALERAFRDTYDMEMKDVFGNEDLAIGSYRYAVKSVIPGMTRVAWDLKKDTLLKETSGLTRRKFLYNISRSSYEKEWGKSYHQPGLGTKILAFFLRLVPAKGPFRALRIRMPTPEVEKLFMASFNSTIERYKAVIATVGSNKMDIPNQNLDAGGAIAAGKYKGSDEAYGKLVEKLADRKFDAMTPDLGQDILAYYKDWTPAVIGKPSKKTRSEAKELGERLEGLQQAMSAVKKVAER